MVSAVKNNQKNYTNWKDDLIATLTQELCKFNSDLSSYEHKIEEIRDDIESKKVCKQMLGKSKEYVEGLLNIQGGVDND